MKIPQLLQALQLFERSETIGSETEKHEMPKGSGPTKLGNQIRQLRNEAGLSLNELGKRCGLDRATLMRIETGETPQPEISTLNSLARALNIEAEIFYDALWQDSEKPLPSMATYFRRKYRLNRDQIDALEKSFAQISKSRKSRTTKD
ncbi:MAG: helix-turn-helix domain-containing protein [Actinomycetota bacterium]